MISVSAIILEIMLRRAENIEISFSTGFMSGSGWLDLALGSTTYRIAKYRKGEFRELVEEQKQMPVKLAELGDRSYWWFQDLFYWDNDGLSQEDVYALLIVRQKQQRLRIDRAKATVAVEVEVATNKRGAIPDDLKMLVWTRDEGKCNNCGSQVELQFDHVIPISLGGATSEANLQILCGICNRRKGAGLTN